MLRWLTLLFLSLFLLSGCAVSLFEVKYIPPPKAPRATQPGTGEEGSSSLTLVEISRKETQAGTKVWQLNAALGTAIQGLSSDNCIQGVELSNGDVVVDFGNTACPATPGELIPAENIQFTLFQEEGAQEGCNLNFSLMLDVDPLGAGSVNICSDPPAPVLNDLCTGDYAAKCELLLKANQFYQLLLK